METDNKMDLEDLINTNSNQGALANVQHGADLMIQFKGQNTRFKSSLIGMEVGSFLVVSTPQAPDSGQKIGRINRLANTRVVVRYLWNGTVWGFESTVLNTILNPAPITFLSYPEIIERHDLRSHERVTCAIPSKIEKVEGGAERSGMIVDISLRGCKFNLQIGSSPQGEGAQKAGNEESEIGDPFKVSDQIILAMRLPGDDTTYTCEGEVKNIISDEDKAALGLRFSFVPPEIEKLINDYVEQASSLLSF